MITGAGRITPFNRCDEDLSGDVEHGVLTVTDHLTGTELLRWDFSAPQWVYERTDVPSELAASR